MNHAEVDIYVVARGLPLNQVGDWTWRVKMSKMNRNISDACGFALYSPDLETVTLARVWNSNGEDYETEAGPWLVELTPALDDGIDDALTFEDETCTLELHFRKRLTRSRDPDRCVRHQRTIYEYIAELHVLDADGARLPVWGNRTVFSRPVGFWGPTIHVAPFVRLWEYSTATLERIPYP